MPPKSTFFTPKPLTGMLWRMLGASHPMDAHRVDSRGIMERGRSADSREGVVSFLEKRPARYPDKVRALGLCGVAAEMPVHPEMLESAKANTLKVQELMTFWVAWLPAVVRPAMTRPASLIRATSTVSMADAGAACRNATLPFESVWPA